MEAVVLGLHVLLAIGTVVLVLLQQGKGADAGAAFGSGASGTVFGAGGPGTFLQRMTTLAATLFFATSLALAVMAAHRSDSDSLLDRTAPAEMGEELPADSDLPGMDEGPDDADTPVGDGGEGDLPPIDEE